jgi:flagellar P-ring protein precursor FlgI
MIFCGGKCKVRKKSTGRASYDLAWDGLAFSGLLRFASALLCCAVWVLPVAAAAESGTRLKDLVSIEGVRGNQLIGYGLVVGLNGTGDRQQTLFSAQSLINLLQRMGVSMPAGSITVKDTAAVLVTATLPPYGQPGNVVDATVAAIGDATNLQGGLLVLSTLRGVNGQVYATVQGPVVTAGFVAGRSSNSTTVNHPTAGRIPNGVTIERAAPSVPIGSVVKLQLREADFETSVRISAAVNQHFHAADPLAHADNSDLVSVRLPEEYKLKPTEFVAELERLLVEPDREARVVINEKTGTVVMGADVHIAPVAIMQGNLTVSIQTKPLLVPAGPFSSAPSTTVPETTVKAKDDKSRNLILKDGATVEELVRALAAIGSTTRDVVAILESLKAAGALQADLEII